MYRALRKIRFGETRSYDEIARKIGIPTSALDRVNSSTHRQYRDYYDDELIAGVAKLYSRDLELFGYEF